MWVSSNRPSIGGGGHFARAFTGQMDAVNGIIAALVECCLAQKQVGVPGGYDHPGRGIGVARIRQHTEVTSPSGVGSVASTRSA